MPLRSTVLFGSPQTEIANLLNYRIANARTIKIVVGFTTLGGIKLIERALTNDPRSLKTLVIGASTYSAYEALDELIQAGIPNRNLYVHLGHTRYTNPNGRNPFLKYHPMLHSKVYYFENGDGSACTIIGSHNITSFALSGNNGEASVMLEGDVNDPEFEKVRNHIEIAKRQAVLYRPEMKEAYAWWANQYMEGLFQVTNDAPKEVDKRRTILIFCQRSNKAPRLNEILYFELPEALGKLQSLSAEVHVFVFDQLPATPSECLANMSDAQQSFLCSVEGVENNKGGKELSAHWYIDPSPLPTLQSAPNPFRPRPKPRMQQIRVLLGKPVKEKHDYLFGKQVTSWYPVLNDNITTTFADSYDTTNGTSGVIKYGDKECYLVTDLSKEKPFPEKKAQTSQYELALKSLEPESGAFILLSTGRKKKEKGNVNQYLIDLISE